MTNRLSERHIMALNYLLITVLAYFAALAANDILISRSRVAESVARAVPRVAALTPSHSRSDYQAIVDRDIFNIAPVPVAAPPPPLVEDLQLKLIGVSRMSKGKPFAIIEDQRGLQAVYRVGEEIPDSGKLLAVETDRAIVEHDGRQIVVELPKDEISSGRMLRRLGIGMEIPNQMDNSDQTAEPDSSIDSSTDPGQDQEPQDQEDQ
jgi:type II secretory pathway component PulC